MAKPHIKTHKSKPKFCLFLCCFGSNSRETPMESDHNPQKKIRWFSWRRTQKMKTGTKTVPLDGSLSGKKRRADHIHSSKSKSKSKAKSKSNPQKPPLIKSETPATNPPPPPSQTSPEVPVVPNQAPSLIRHKHKHKHRAQQNHTNNLENGNSSDHMASSEEDTRQQCGPARAMSRTVSLPSAKRQDKGLSSLSMQPQTTLKKENARRYDPFVGMSAVLVTLVIMILWGRLCATLCTSAWFYLIRRFRMVTENDIKNMNTYSTNPDFDSKVYKKKVILEGLLERNHRGTL